MISLIWTASLLAPLTVELPLTQTVLPSAKLSLSSSRALPVPPLPVEPIIKQRRPSQKSSIQARVAKVTTLHSFTNDDEDGAYPLAEVTKVGDFLYGTTYQGGTEDDGTVFRLNSLNQRVETLYSFNTNATDGTNPTARLTPDGTGAFYSTTYLGGSDNVGTIFRINRLNNRLETIRNFTRTNGAFPFAGVSLNAAGTLYGTTVGGGSSGFGTVFQLSRVGASFGAIRVRHNFRNGTDGARPYGGVILDSASNLYGTTNIGGTNALGTVFRLLSPAAALGTLYSFKRSDGFYSFGSLVRDSSGNLYGTTCNGGTSGNGTVFRLSPSRDLTTLYSFKGSDGKCPTAGVTLDAAGDLYGTTYQGGSNDKGTVFKLILSRATPVLQSLAHFTDTGTDGANPEAGVILSGAFLYGTTRLGGSDNYGTVYRLRI